MSNHAAAVAPAVPQFTVSRPTMVDDAIERKRTLGDDGRFWAGGTDLMLEWRRRQRSFRECIDLSSLDELKKIEVHPTHLKIGALATLDQIDRAADRSPDLEFLASIARVMCTVQTRTLATLGGNLVNASPAADLAPPLIALDGLARLLSFRGVREVPIAELFVGPKLSLLARDELLTHVVVPSRQRRAAAYERIARTHVDIALALVAAAVEVDQGGLVVGARVALGSAAPRPVLVNVDQLLLGRRVRELDQGLLNLVGTAAAASATPIDDVRTSASYRREMCAVLTRRALRTAANLANDLVA